MYCEYWKLDRRPFDDFADAAFYYPGESHQGAMLKLRYVIENRQAAALLAGAAGIGKSQLASTLLAQLPEHFSPRVHLMFPDMPAAQLLGFIAAELDGGEIPNADVATGQSVRRIENLLNENAERGRHAVVVADEAQLLANTGALELMRMLLNFETSFGTGLTLLLVGQPNILPAIDRLPSLEERLSVKCLMRPLSADDTAGYVSHRLQVAGAIDSIFTDDAFAALHSLSGGLPRRINRLADLALLISFAEERTSIGADQIEAVSEELVTIAPE